jgi:glycosyltransferase involved in cell wall biosynthesis
VGHRVYITIHGSQFVLTSKAAGWRLLYRTVLNRARRVAVLNSEVSIAAKAIGVGPVVVLPNPGPVGRHPETLDAGQSSPTVVFAGAVGHRKGVDVLLDAWQIVAAEMPHARLEIIGPVVDAAIGSRAAPYLLGPKNAEEVHAALSHARVAVLPSRAEGMPMFLLEALGMGRPLVVSDVGAMPVLASKTGIVTPVGDSTALAHALLEFLQDPARASAAGAEGLALYKANYGVEVVERALRNFYDEN